MSKFPKPPAIMTEFGDEADIRQGQEELLHEEEKCQWKYRGCPKDRPCKICGCKPGGGWANCNCVDDSTKKALQEKHDDKMGWAHAQQGFMEDY